MAQTEIPTVALYVPAGHAEQLGELASEYDQGLHYEQSRTNTPALL